MEYCIAVVLVVAWGVTFLVAHIPGLVKKP